MAKKNQVNEMGEIVEYVEPKASALAVPDMSEVKEVSKVAGSNPRGVNLRDHPEFDGLNFICVGGRITRNAEGDSFIIATGFIYPDGVKPTLEDHAVTLVTGSGNVFERIVIAMQEVAFPIKGKLRRAGRAWFLD